MSEMSLVAAMSRIRAALPSSPIAVFRAPYADGHVDCVFANTIKTQTEIRLKTPSYIGTFSCADHPEIVRATLAIHTGGM